jgi:hypothetical protein
MREPLLHFLAVGAALFGLYAWLGGGGGDGARASEIVVTRGRIESLVETFARPRHRAPAEDELAGLVRDFVREEVLAREAIALGLDRDDTVVRRRLAQKMEFLSEDDAATTEPTDDELRAFLAAHPEQFRLDSRISFTQVFLDRERRGDALEADAAKLLAALNAPGIAPDPTTPGDGRMLEAHFENVGRADVEARFGADFVARLEQLPLGRFEGPVESGYGVHLVRVARHTPASIPALDEVRDAVAREWSAAKRLEAKERRLQAILARYRVTVEGGGAEEPDRIAGVSR